MVRVLYRIQHTTISEMLRHSSLRSFGRILQCSKFRGQLSTFDPPVIVFSPGDDADEHPPVRSSSANGALAHLRDALKPREVVEELNKYIVGQNEAKRAVAIALRNRWRRHQLPESLRGDVIPKNILMIGPTG